MDRPFKPKYGTVSQVLLQLIVARKLRKNKTLQSVHFGVVVVELINCKCGGIVRNEIW